MPHSNRAAGGGLGGGVCDVDSSLKKNLPDADGDSRKAAH